jgi:hypothetical protein
MKSIDYKTDKEMGDHVCVFLSTIFVLEFRIVSDSVVFFIFIGFFGSYFFFFFNKIIIDQQYQNWRTPT